MLFISVDGFMSKYYCLIVGLYIYIATAFGIV